LLVDEGEMHCEASKYHWIFTMYCYAMARQRGLAFYNKIIKLPAALQITVLLNIATELINLQ